MTDRACHLGFFFNLFEITRAVILVQFVWTYSSCDSSSICLNLLDLLELWLFSQYVWLKIELDSEMVEIIIVMDDLCPHDEPRSLNHAHSNGPRMWLCQKEKNEWKNCVPFMLDELLKLHHWQSWNNVWEQPHSGQEFVTEPTYTMISCDNNESKLTAHNACSNTARTASHLSSIFFLGFRTSVFLGIFRT